MKINLLGRLHGCGRQQHRAKQEPLPVLNQEEAGPAGPGAGL